MCFVQTPADDSSTDSSTDDESVINRDQAQEIGVLLNRYRQRIERSICNLAVKINRAKLNLENLSEDDVERMVEHVELLELLTKRCESIERISEGLERGILERGILERLIEELEELGLLRR